MTDDLSYDPMVFSSPEDYAHCRASMDQELGMPSEPYAGPVVGRLVNELHFRHQAEMRDAFGWHGTTRERLRKECGL